MPHSQRLCNNPYPEPNLPNSPIDTYLFKVHVFKVTTVLKYLRCSACTLCTYICSQGTAAITATFERVYSRLYIFEMPPLI